MAQSDKEKADAFNSFFASNEDISSLPDFQVDTSIPILSNVSVTSNFFYVKLHNLNPNKSAGPDNWPTKEMAEQLCLPLTILFTKSLRASTLPGARACDTCL